jgi:hypothetical protein
LFGTIVAQQPYSGSDSKGITMIQSGLVGPVVATPDMPVGSPGYASAVVTTTRTVSFYFDKNPNTNAATALYGNPNHVYFRSSGLNPTTILHEALHTLTSLGDIPLAAQLGRGQFTNRESASGAIGTALKDAGCK